MVIEGPGWRIVYSGDLRSSQELGPYIEGCDLLIHEMAHVHPEEVADFAAAAKVPHTLITHIGPEFDEAPEKIIKAFAGRYSGKLTVAEDGTRVRLKQPTKRKKRTSPAKNATGEVEKFEDKAEEAILAEDG